MKIIASLLLITFIGIPQAHALYEENENTRPVRGQGDDEMSITSVDNPESDDEVQVTTVRRDNPNTARHEAFRQQAMERLNTQQQAVALRTAQNINNVNQKMTDRYLHHLSLMEQILDKINARSQVFASTGTDTTEVTTAVASAQETLNSIRNAINEQAQKDYVVDVENSQTIGEALRTTIQELRADLTAIQNQLIEARRLIQNAFLTLKNIAVSAAEPSEETNEPASSPLL